MNSILGNIDYLDVGIIFFDASHRCTQINVKAAELLDQSSGAIIGLTLENILKDYFAAPVLYELTSAIENEGHQPLAINGLPLNRNQEGFHRIYVDLSLKPLLDGQGEYQGSVLTLVNISHHQAKINELEKSKGLLVGILDNTTNVVYAKNLEGKNILINTQYEKIFNLKKEDVIGKIGCADILPPEIVEIVRANDMLVIQTGEVINFEEEILHDDGIHSYLSTKFPLRDSKGNTFGVGGMSVDITDMKQTEKLNESLNHILSSIHTSLDFDTIMQKILDESVKAIGADRAGITIIEDEHWVMRYGFGEMQKWVGHSFPYNDSLISIIAAEGKKIIAIEDCLNDERTANSVMIKYGVKSCLIFPLITRGEAVGVLSFNYLKPKKFNQKEIDYINKLGSAVSLALDNAYHQENLEKLVKIRTNELRSSEQRFAKAFNSIPNLMAITNLEDGRYIEVNTYFLNCLGYKSEEVIGKTAIELNILSSEDRNEIARGIEENGEVLNYECKLQTKDGQIREGLMTAGIIELNGEKCILGITKDITERNRLLRELTRLDQLNLVGEMAAGIGHEIRNPMTTVRGFLQMLGNKKDCLQYNEYFMIMIDELDRANSIITEFLSMAKNKAVSLSKNNLNNIVKAISSLISADAMIYDKRIKLELGDIPEILIDEKETRQLILNLSRNGLEAMGAGGVLTIKTSIDQGKVVLAVQDEGKGIEPGILEKLGTPFFTTKENGTGLGLAVCYSIAARHKANIQIETSGEGSTFYVYYPTM